VNYSNQCDHIRGRVVVSFRTAVRPRYLCLLASVASITTVLGACSSSNGEFVELPGTASSIPSAVGLDQGPALPARSVDNPGAYTVGYADVLDISVFKVPELARTVEVAESGTITFPPVGEVSVVGKSVREIEHDLAERLEARYLRSPQVNVSVKEFNSQPVTVEGAVMKPGLHALKGKTTLLQLVAMSGGIDRDISDSTVVLFRNADGQRNATTFNIDDIRTGQAPDPLIFPGDMVIAKSSPLKAAWSEVIRGMQPATTAKTMTNH
jgi:polysaccharide biosynthesis/export protein